MEWLSKYIEVTKETDRFDKNPNKVQLLAAGLMGEAGSVLSELKKSERELNAYPSYRNKMLEEIGDLLWYYIRLVDAIDPTIFKELNPVQHINEEGQYPTYMELGGAVGSVLGKIKNSQNISSDPNLREEMFNVWHALLNVAHEVNIRIEAAASNNLKKITSRWPTDKKHSALFDEQYGPEEQIPRKLEIEFLERTKGNQSTIFLRCNNMNFGDRLTDNIESQDGYRYHDVFHFAYAAHLGWSPVVRSLLRCKRKSNPDVDEAQDSARAAIIEEAVSATVFSRAKKLSYFDGLDHVDYDLLKTIQEFVEGFEVEQIPLWQWEDAILDGFRLFRLLRHNRGGTISWDLNKRKLTYTAPHKV